MDSTSNMQLQNSQAILREILGLERDMLTMIEREKQVLKSDQCMQMGLEIASKAVNRLASATGTTPVLAGKKMRAEHRGPVITLD